MIKNTETNQFFTLNSESAEQLKKIIDHIPGGIAVMEIDINRIPDSLRFTYYNDRFFGFSGYTREENAEFLGQNLLYFVFNDDIPVIVSAMEKLCAGEIGASTDITLRCHVKDGGYRWLLLTEQLVKKTGTHCVIHIIMMDITQRKKATDEKRISDEMLRIAAETDKRAIILYDVKANTCQVESRNLYSAKYGEVIENIPQTLIDLGVVNAESTE